MSLCINKKHPEYKALIKSTGLNESVLSAKIALWQVENQSDEFPTKDELISSNVRKTDDEVTKSNIKELSKEFYPLLNKLGIKIDVIKDLESKFGVDAIGVADIVNKVISLQEGKAGKEELVEEISHFAIKAIDPNNKALKRALELVSETETYKKNYKAYMAQYKSESKVREEVLGQVLRDELLQAEELQKKSSLARLIHTIWNKFIGLFNNSELKTFINQHANNIANNKLDSYKSENLNSNEQFYALSDIEDVELEELLKTKTNLNLSESILNKILEVEEFKYKVYNKSRKTKSSRITAKKTIKTIKEDIEKGLTLKGFVDFAKFADREMFLIQKRIEKLKTDPNLSNEDKASTIVSIDKYSSGTIPVVQDLIEEIKNIQLLNEDLTTEDKKLLKNTLESLEKANTVSTYSKKVKSSLQKELAADELMNYVGSSGITKDKLMILLTESEDITMYERHANTMAYSSDSVIKLTKMMVDELLIKAQQKHDGYMIDIRNLAKKNNINDFEKFYEKDSDGKLTGFFIADFDYGTFSKNKAEFFTELNEKFNLSGLAKDRDADLEIKKNWDKKTKRSYNTAISTWFKANTQNNPKAEQILKDKQKEIHDEIVIEKEDKDKIAQQENHAQQVYDTWLEDNVIRNNKTGRITGYKNELSIPADSYKTDSLSKLNEKELEFYNKFIQVKKEIDSKFNVSTDLYLAPQLRKDSFERIVKAEGFNNKMKQGLENFKDSVQVTEDETEIGIKESYRDASGKEHKFLPIFFNNQITDPNKNLSTDIISSMGAYIDMGTRYEAFSKKEDIIQLILDTTKERSIVKGDRWTAKIGDNFKRLAGKDQTTTGAVVDKGGVAADALEKYLDMIMYREVKLDHGSFSFAGMEVNKAKLADLLNKYTAIRGLSLNLHSAIANVTLGNAYIRQEKIANEWFKKGSLTFADKTYWANITESISEMDSVAPQTKLNLFAEKFDVFQDYESRVGDQRANRSRFTRIMSLNKLFILQHAGEHQMQMRTALALAHDTKVYIDGKQMNLWEAYKAENGMLVAKGKMTLDEKGTQDFNEKNIAKYILKLHRINQKLHGIYNKRDMALMNRTAGGRMLTLFRKFLVPSINRRYGKAKFDHMLDQEVEGMYNSFGKFTWDLIKDMKRGEFHYKAKWDSLTDHQKANIWRTGVELLQMVSIAIVIGFLSAALDGGDDEDMILLNSLAVQANRLFTEIGAYTPLTGPSEMMKIVKSPAAGISTVGPILRLVTDTFDPWSFTNDERDFIATYKSGKNKGRSRFAVNLEKSLPVVKNIQSIMDPSDLLKYYKQ